MTIYKDAPCVVRLTELDPCYPVTVCDDPDAESLVCQQNIRGEVGLEATTTDDKTYTLPADCRGTVAEIVEVGKLLKYVTVTMKLCSVNKEMEVWLTGQKPFYDGAGDTVGIGYAGTSGTIDDRRFMVEWWQPKFDCNAGDCPDEGEEVFDHFTFYSARDFVFGMPTVQGGTLAISELTFRAYHNPKITATSLPAFTTGAWSAATYPSGVEVFTRIDTTDVPSLPGEGARCAWVPTPGPDLCTVTVQSTLGPLASNQITAIVVNGETYGPSPFFDDAAGVEAFLNAIPGLTNWNVTTVPGTTTYTGKAKCGWLTSFTTTVGLRTHTETPVVCP